MVVDDEIFLQKLVWLVGIVHVACAYGAASISIERGQPWKLPALKVQNLAHRVSALTNILYLHCPTSQLRLDHHDVAMHRISPKLSVFVGLDCDCIVQAFAVGLLAYLEVAFDSKNDA